MAYGSALSSSRVLKWGLKVFMADDDDRMWEVRERGAGASDCRRQSKPIDWFFSPHPRVRKRSPTRVPRGAVGAQTATKVFINSHLNRALGFVICSLRDSTNRVA